MHTDFEGSDEEIVALARQGGEGALRRATAEALRRYVRDLYAHVRSRLPAEEEAVRDILQEVALAVVEGLPRVRSGAALRPWILQVASHKVYDHLRRRHRERSRVDADLGTAVLEALADENSTMECLLERAGEEQLAAYVRRTLDRLKPRHREAVSLVYFDGLSVEAAAERLTLRADAMAALLYRARRSFEKLLAEDARRGRAEAPIPVLEEAVRKC